MQLKIYQENAIEELLEKSKKLLDYQGNKKLVFKSPTGSGKTIMVAEFLKQLVEDREVKQHLSFIWTAPRKLHEQSKQKLEKYFEKSRALECSFFEDLDDRKVSADEILFFNWESINRADNIYIRENERDNNLSYVIDRTKEEGREIILIIDECHHHATSEISQGLIEMINPKLTLEVSATPVVEDPDESVTVQLEEVKAEGMIKKSVLLNPDFENVLRGEKIESELSKGSEETVIEAALQKRNRLLESYQQEEANINPLILIQLPDRKTRLEDVIKERVISILRDKYHITTENGKLAIHLSGHHENLENISKSNNEVEVLIFKQALALGWDCPRAQILALFRDWKSLVFSIQTIGRIMRMPEPDHGHYAAENLNYGYVYTNLENIQIEEDIARNYITIFTSKRRPDYEPIDLLSCHSERHREKTRLSPLFIEIFLQEAKEYGLKEKLDIKAKKLAGKVISDWKIEDLDLAGAGLIGEERLEYGLGSFDLQKIFDFFVQENLTPFYPEDRSVGRVKTSIYRFFEQEFGLDYSEVQDEIVQITLSNKNHEHFVNVLDLAKGSYQREVEKREPELVFDEGWDIPESLSFSGDYVKEDRVKSVMQPFYAKYASGSEKAFVEHLEKSEVVEWWFKNGDRDAKFFAVPYDNGEEKPFYVDFIVKRKDGRIGLFDPHGRYLADFEPKNDGLYHHIQSENKKRKNLFGGIAANTDQNEYRGRWVYFDRSSAELEDGFSSWKNLEL